MNLRTVFDANGNPATLDDMSPQGRALAVLLEHANLRNAAGRSLPCRCRECVAIRQCFRAEKTAEGLALFYSPPTPPDAQP